jgi:arginyl-tRNA synthetase
MNVFRLFEERVAQALGRLADAGDIPAGLAVRARRGRASARSLPRRSRHQRRHGAREGRQDQSPRLAEKIAEDLRADARVVKVDVAGRASST